MELRDVRAFVEVARSGSYRAAAERLYVAQPAVWRHVHALERELGVRLFERAGRNVRLTAAGSDLLARADAMLEAALDLARAADDLRSGRTGVVRLACYTPTLERFLAPLLGQFERAHPNVRIEIHEFPATGGNTISGVAGSLSELFEGRVDIALGPAAAEGTDGFRVDESRIVALIAAGHPWASKGSVAVEDLRGVPLLLLANRDSFSRSSIEHAARGRGFDLSVKLESASAAALAALAEHGVGIAILPDAVVPDRFRGLSLPVEPGDEFLRREVWLTWRRGSPLSATALAFVEAARTAAASDRTLATLTPPEPGTSADTRRTLPRSRRSATPR